jgi:hypothetical protein
MSTLSNFTPFRRADASVHFARAAFTHVHAAASGDVHSHGVIGVAKSLWGEDGKAAAMLLRSAVSPTDTTAAAVFARNAISDFISGLHPLTAAARLISAGIPASLDGIDILSFPKRVGSLPASNVAWVRQGNAIPVRQFALNDVDLGPVKKLATISVISREVAERASGESVVSTLLREDIAASLDAGMFNTAAADADRPAGILNGVSPLTATASGSSTEKMIADLEQLSGAIADAGGSDVIFIAATRQANAARLRLGATRGVNVWPSASLAAGTVIAVEPAAFVSAFGATPKITASIEATVHMSDTPTALSISGTPNTVAAPSRSMWQTDCIALKCVLDCAWALRADGRVAYLTGATWGAAA